MSSHYSNWMDFLHDPNNKSELFPFLTSKVDFPPNRTVLCYIRSVCNFYHIQCDDDLQPRRSRYKIIVHVLQSGYEKCQSSYCWHRCRHHPYWCILWVVSSSISGGHLGCIWHGKLFQPRQANVTSFTHFPCTNCLWYHIFLQGKE